MSQPTKRTDESAQQIGAAVGAVRGHFRYESGQHGDLWLSLDTMFADARRVETWARALDALLPRAQAVVGPVTGGAFLAQALAGVQGASFYYTDRVVDAGEVSYRLPAGARTALSGARVVLVDDVVNAGSAVTASLTQLHECGATVIGMAALMSLGDAGDRLARRHRVAFHSLAGLEREIWPARSCRLCTRGVPLQDRPPGG